MFNGTLASFLDQVMTPFRHVRIEPLLLEVLILALMNGNMRVLPGHGPFSAGAI